jgi:hypothetical protein
MVDLLLSRSPLSPPPLLLLPSLCNRIPLARQQFPAGCRLLLQRYSCCSAPLASPCLSSPGHLQGVVALPLVTPPLPLIVLMPRWFSTHRLVVALPLIAPAPPLVLLAHPCLSMHRLCHPSSQPWLGSCQHVGNMSPRQPNVGTFGQHAPVVAT